MAQSNLITRERAIYLAEESAFGTPPSASFPNVYTRVLADGTGLQMDGLTHEMLDVNDVRVRREDAIDPVLGLALGSKIGAIKWNLKATKTANQLTAAGSVGSLTPTLALRHAFGAAHEAVGSIVDVATVATTTAFSVTAGDGVNFAKGTWIAVLISGQMEAAKIADISTNLITLASNFPLSVAPATGATVRQLRTFAPAETHTSSLACRVAYVGDSAAQYEAAGCFGDLNFMFNEWGKLAQMSLELEAVACAGPAALSYSTATASDEMGTSFGFLPQIYLASGGTITRGTVTSDIPKFGFEHKNNWEKRRDPSATATVGGASQATTVAGIVNTGGRPRAVKAMATVRFDSAYQTAYDARTQFNIVALWRIGTGATASFWVWEIPNAYINARPKLENVDARGYIALEFGGLQDASVTLASETGTALDLVLATCRVAYG